MFIDKLRAKEFQAKGFHVYRNLYNVNMPTNTGHQSLIEYTRSLENGIPDAQSPGSPSFYGDIEMYRVMMNIMPKVERATGKKLFPTYNYFRNYGPMGVLDRHKDRPACEISCTLNIGYTGSFNWPICVKDYQGVEHSVTLQPGDALLYKGHDLEHWREPSNGRVEFQSQVFMHFVDQTGPFADHIFDKNNKK